MMFTKYYENQWHLMQKQLRPTKAKGFFVIGDFVNCELAD